MTISPTSYYHPEFNVSLYLALQNTHIILLEASSDFVLLHTLRVHSTPSHMTYFIREMTIEIATRCVEKINPDYDYRVVSWVFGSK